jgi:hypothetical protein
MRNHANLIAADGTLEERQLASMVDAARSSWAYDPALPQIGFDLEQPTRMPAPLSGRATARLLAALVIAAAAAGSIFLLAV